MIISEDASITKVQQNSSFQIPYFKIPHQEN